MTLTSGVYKFASTAGLTGTLTLDGQNDPNSVFVFQVGSSLSTLALSSVLLINQASACRIFWQIGSSATLGAGSSFSGSVVALTSIALTAGATVSGRVLALNGAVTMDTNRVTICAEPPPPTPTPSVTPTPTEVPTDLPMFTRRRRRA